MFLAASSVVSYSLHSVSRFVLSSYSSPLSTATRHCLVSHSLPHSWLVCFHLSPIVTVFRFLFVFGSTVLLLFALISYLLGTPRSPFSPSLRI